MPNVSLEPHDLRNRRIPQHPNLENESMTKRTRLLLAGLITANVLTWCMLGFYRTTGAAPAQPQLPFRNAVEQRQDMIRELQEIKALLKEQNGLLRAQAKAEAIPR